MAYPTLGAGIPTFDQWGNAYSVSPLVSKSSAGAMATGQSLFSASLRENAASTGTVTFPLLTVPANGVIYITDIQATGAAIVANAELIFNIVAGTCIIAQASLGPTSPIATIFETQPLAPSGTVISVQVTNANATTPAFDIFVSGYYQQFGF